MHATNNNKTHLFKLLILINNSSTILTYNIHHFQQRIFSYFDTFFFFFNSDNNETEDYSNISTLLRQNIKIKVMRDTHTTRGRRLTSLECSMPSVVSETVEGGRRRRYEIVWCRSCARAVGIFRSNQQKITFCNLFRRWVTLEKSFNIP